MNKKGLRIFSEQMFILFEIILIALIAVALLNYVYSFASSSLYERAWVSHDLKMVIETAASSPNLLIYNYSMPAGDVVTSRNTNISIIQTSLNMTVMEPKVMKKVTSTLAMVYSAINDFLEPKPGTKFQIIQNQYQTVLTETSKEEAETDIRQLVCERYKQKSTKTREKKTIGLNKNPSNERVVNLINDSFSLGAMSAFYEIKDKDWDMYLHITCSATNRITINKPTIENQKFACLLADKIIEIKYDDIWQTYDDILIGKAPIAIHLQFNCNPKRASAIVSAIDEYYS